MRRTTIGLLRSPVFLLVLLVAILVPFAVIGIYTLLHPTVEPQPGPKPVVTESAPTRPAVLVEVIAQYPGASAEEVERQVTVPLEVGMAGMPHLKYIRSKSRFGLSCVSLQFEDRTDRDVARREVIDRLGFLQALPPGVTPQLSPVADEAVRYVLRSPRDAQGRDIYTLSDLRACQDWILDREFRRLPGVIDVDGVGGTVKRYEVHLDPERLRRYGVTIQQVRNALTAANANVEADFLGQGDLGLNVRAVGLFGGGTDPMQKVLGMKDPLAAALHLRDEEVRRVDEIRKVVVTTVNTVSVRLEDVVEGGRLMPGEPAGLRGVVVAPQRRFGRVGLAVAGRSDENDLVEGIVWRRPGEDPKEVLERTTAKIKEINETPERLPPGIRIELVHEARPFEGPAAPDAPLWVRGTFPAALSQEAATARANTVRGILAGFPEVRLVLSQVGSGEDPDTVDANQVECLLLFKPERDWLVPDRRDRPRTRSEVAEEVRAELKRTIVGVDWVVSPHRRDPFLSAFVAAPDEELLRIVGPDLHVLDRLAGEVKTALTRIGGIEDVAVCKIMGRPNLEFRVDPAKCAKWGVKAADVNDLIQTALGVRAVARMVEGERLVDVAVRFPGAKSILDLPVDISNNQAVPAVGPVPAIRPDVLPLPPNEKALGNTLRLRLRDLVSPIGPDGALDPKGEFERVGPSVIYREQGRRCIGVTFRIGAGDRVALLEKARQETAELIEVPYQVEWDRRR
jgi:Cu/Ag efflux pump CusA